MIESEKLIQRISNLRQNFQRFYLYILTENVKSIIMKHRKVLLSDDVKRRFNLNERDISAVSF